MEITTSSHTGRVPVTVFHLKGDLDIKTSNLLEEQAQNAYTQGTRFVILDFTGVRYVSSAGLRAIQKAWDILRKDDSTESDSVLKKGVREGVYKSHHLKLAGLSQQVLQVLRISGYDMLLDIFPDIDSAVKAF